jgi:hypothetical protein
MFILYICYILRFPIRAISILILHLSLQYYVIHSLYCNCKVEQ